jgi:type II secretory pathway component GspD/PulD (secretin)
VLLLRFAVAVLLTGTAVTAVQGQVVQLPTFNYFTIQTSVLVPDSGRGYLGGVRRGSWGSLSRGVPGFGRIPGLSPLFGGRAVGGGGSTSVTAVRATIIDHDALDKAVLAAAAGRSDSTRRTVAEARPTTGRVSSLQSLAEIRRQNAAKKEARQKEAEQIFAQGHQAEVDGKYGVARIFYRRAAKIADGELAQKIASRLASIDAIRSVK